MGRTLWTIWLASRSEESRQRIGNGNRGCCWRCVYRRCAKELEVSQVELAKALGVSQPAVVAMEQRGSDIALSP